MSRKKYGPYYRLETSSQSVATAKLQQESGEIWGKGYRGALPSVNAYDGALPAGEKGVEFYTDVEPDKGNPPGRASWTGPREGVRIEGEYGVIEVEITVNSQIV